ncbi:MAG: PKD-like domain-containing protein [Bacteroidota bacterium]
MAIASVTVSEVGGILTILDDAAAPASMTTYDIISVTSPAGCDILATLDAMPASSATAITSPLVPTITVTPAPEIPELDVAVNSPAGADIDEVVLVCSGDLVELVADFLPSPSAVDRSDYRLNVEATGQLSIFNLGQATTVFDLAGFNAQFSQTPQNLSSADLTVDLTITPYLEDGTPGFTDECAGEPVTVSVTVLPRIQSTVVNPVKSILSDMSVNIDLAQFIDVPAGGTGIEFYYTVSADGPIDVNGSSDLLTIARPIAMANADPITDGEFENQSGDIVTVTYNVTPVNPTTGCEGASFPVEVVVYPEPVVAIDEVDSEICSEDDLDLFIEEPTGISVPGGGTVTYELLAVDFGSLVPNPGNAPLGPIGTGTLESDEYTNITSGPVDVVYTIQATYELNSSVATMSNPAVTELVGDEYEFTVTVEPSPNAIDEIAGSDNNDGGLNSIETSICNGGIFNVTDLIAELTTNNVGDASDVFYTRRTDPVADGVGVDVDVFQQTGGGGEFFINFCGNERQRRGSSCNGPEPGFTNLNSISDRLLASSFAVPAYVWYDVFIDEGCGGTNFTGPITIQVEILPQPTATLSSASGSTELCSGETLTLETLVSGGAPNLEFDYSIESATGDADIMFPDPPFSNTVDITSSGTGIVQVRVDVTSEDGACDAVAFLDITVGETPAENPIVGPSEPCSGGNAQQYSVVSTPGNTYVWTLDSPANGAGILSPSGATAAVTFSSAGGPYTLTVVESTPSGCSTTNTLEINVVDDASVDFSFTISPTNPLEVSFQELAEGNVVNYAWDFDDDGTFEVVGPNETNPTFTYPADGTYMATLLVRTQCDPFSPPVDLEITKTITVGAGIVCQDLVLTPSATNFISLTVVPAAGYQTFDEVFLGTGITEVSTYISGSAAFWEPNGGVFNGISGWQRGYGYLITNGTASTVTVQICGTEEDGSERHPLDGFINLVGTALPTDQMVTDYFAAIIPSPLNVVFSFRNGPQEYFEPNGGVFNSLETLVAGDGYVVVVDQPTTKVVAGEDGRAFVPGEAAEFIKGYATGTAIDPNKPVEVLTKDGQLVGVLDINEYGLFKSTGVYGRVNRINGGAVSGLEDDEEYIFRHNGVTFEPGTTYQGGFHVKRQDLVFNLEVTEEVVDYEMTLSPNPVADQSQVSLLLGAAGTYSVQVIDMNGRMVNRIVDNTSLPVGRYTYDWDTSNLPAGMYLITVVKDGELLSDLSIRAVK